MAKCRVQRLGFGLHVKNKEKKAWCMFMDPEICMQTSLGWVPIRVTCMQ